MSIQSPPPPPSSSPPRKRKSGRRIAGILILLVLAALWAGREKTKSVPGSEKKPVTESEKSVPVPINEKAQAWEVVEIGDVVSLRYPASAVLCENRDEGSQLNYIRAKAESDGLYAFESHARTYRYRSPAPQVIQKGWAARKDAMRSRLSCFEPGKHVRYRVERKEISGTEGDVFHTVYHCLQPRGEDRCVWLVSGYTNYTPFVNVQRPQPVAQTSDTKPPSTIKIRTRTPGCEAIDTALNHPLAEREATEGDEIMGSGDSAKLKEWLKNPTCQFVGGPNTLPGGRRDFSTWSISVPDAVIPPLPPGKVAFCVSGTFIVNPNTPQNTPQTRCHWVIVSQQDVCEVDHSNDFLNRQCWAQW